MPGLVEPGLRQGHHRIFIASADRDEISLNLRDGGSDTRYRRLRQPATAGLRKEDLLAAAGFQIRVADTPQRIAAMRSLPPNKFVTRVVNGSPVYQYADPLVCKCVYFGTQQNWDAYRREMFVQQIANENQMTAIMSQEAWDWGPWGWP